MKPLPQEAKPQALFPRWALAIAVLLPLLLLGAILGYYKWKSRPIIAEDVQELTQRIADRHQRQVDRQHKAWRQENNSFTASAAQQQFQKLRAEMLQTTSATEVDGVLKTFDKTVAGKIGFHPYAGIEKSSIYFWPLYAEKGYLDNGNKQAVWVIDCEWEMNEILRSASFKYPGHLWRLAIDAAPPHKVLHSENCD
jgi:hypothetical protein